MRVARPGSAPGRAIDTEAGSAGRLRADRRGMLFGAVAATVCVAATRTGAQDFAGRPIRIVVPFAAGGVADLTARAIAPGLATRLHTQVVVENKPGAGGIVAGETVARAVPDGHTLLLMTNANAVSSALFKALPFDVAKDFAPISLIGSFGLVIVVAGESRLRSLADLLNEMRSRPGALNIGTINLGSTQHLAAELFKTTAGLDAQIVPFNGTPALITALRGGHVDLAFEFPGPIWGQMGARSLHALAVTGAQRDAGLPDVPTVSEAALPGYQVSSWNALAAPARTPAQVVANLNEALRATLAEPTATGRLRELGVHAQAGSPAELAGLLASEIARWNAVVRAARIEKQ